MCIVLYCLLRATSSTVLLSNQFLNLNSVEIAMLIFEHKDHYIYKCTL